MSANTSIVADNDFGPGIEGFRGGLDFTLVFEDAFLGLVPSALLLIAAPIRTLWLWNASKKVTEDAIRLNKVAFLAGFAVLEFTLLLLWAMSGAWDTPLSIPAAAVDFAAACGLCVLSFFEHSRTVRPSVLINLYMALSLPFDVARTRTLWLIKDFRQMAIVQTLSLALKLGVLVLEAIGKRKILLAPYQDLSHEATSSIYSRSCFWWLNPMFRVGYKKNLELEDLDELDPDLQSSTLFKLYAESWAKANKSRKHSFFYTTFSAIKWPVIICAVPRLLLIGARFAQPFLIKRTTKFVQGTDPDSVGWALVGAYALVYVLLALLTALYSHLQNRSITMIRGGLISLIYAKTVDISLSAVDEASSVTLMSSDIERITTSLAFMHETWAALIEIAIAVYILQQSLGYACLAPLTVAIIVTSLTAFVTRYSSAAQKIWIEAIQSRIAFTSRMLGSMRNIKLLGLSDVVEGITQSFRETEVRNAQGFRWFFLFRVLMGNLNPIITPLATFAVFVITANVTGRRLNTADAFTALSVIELLGDPLALLLSSYTNIVSSLACYDRIQTYLESPSRFDHRLAIATSSRNSILTDSTSTRGIELEDLRVAPKNVFEEVIVVQDASFGWSGSGKAVLQDINVRVRHSSFVFVIGPVGSGKSTLLKGMLGEASSSKGFVYANSLEVAFADQNPWVRNSSIKENILGQSVFNQDLYEAVIDGCELQDDINILPDGDDTVVGSQGISLSGGQKARLALARAVYSKKDIIMLDDVFSGLDADTEESIFLKVFGPTGLLRQHKSTVILVTHAVHRLSYSDHIVAINHGSIVEQGSFESLRMAGGYVQALATNPKEVKEKRESSIPEKRKARTKAKNPKRDAVLDEMARRTGDWSVYKYYARSGGYGAAVSFVVLCFLYGIGLKAPELLTKYWAEAVEKNGNKVNGYFIGLYSITSAVALLGICLSLWIFILIIIPRTASNLHARLLHVVMRAPLSFFTKTDTGSLTSRFSQDLSVIDFELPVAAVQTVFMIAFFFLTFVLILLSTGEFAATVPFVAVVLWVLTRIYLRTSRQVRLLDLETKQPLFSHFGETLNGLATVRAFGWASDFRDQNMVLLDNSQKPFYLLFCIQRWLSVVLDLVLAALVVVLMILVVVLRHKLNPGFVALALLNIVSFNGILTTLVKSYTQFETSIGAVARIRSFLSHTEQESKPQRPTIPDPSWPAKGSIEVKNFSASYSSDSKLVLSNVNLQIRAGEKIGICGRSGSGKSSLLSALLHILEYRDGSIEIDGLDLSTVPRNILRQRLNVIPQEPFFINGSFRLNANPWLLDSDKEDDDTASMPSNIPDEDIIDALTLVTLYSTILSKGGLDAPMESDSLSHGQKQLFCLARAILRQRHFASSSSSTTKPPNSDPKNKQILILDEVTSSVDIETDALMQTIIRNEFRDCTIVAVAHRLNTIKNFDTVVVLGVGGKIVEVGRPGELLERDGVDGEKRSAFRELWDA